MKIELGTARITSKNGLQIVTYYGHGSFLQGQQMFGNAQAARQFCNHRGLKITWVK